MRQCWSIKCAASLMYTMRIHTNRLWVGSTLHNIRNLNVLNCWDLLVADFEFFQVVNDPFTNLYVWLRCSEINQVANDSPPAPGRGATRLRRVSSILYPGSSVLMRSYCSLGFSYFRNAHPVFFVSLYSCMFDTVFCMLKVLQLFGCWNGAQPALNLPPTWRMPRIWGYPMVDVKIH